MVLALCWVITGSDFLVDWMAYYYFFLSVTFNNLKIAHLKSWLKLFNSKKNEQFILLIYSEELLSKHILEEKKAFE